MYKYFEIRVSPCKGGILDGRASQVLVRYLSICHRWDRGEWSESLPGVQKRGGGGGILQGVQNQGWEEPLPGLWRSSRIVSKPWSSIGLRPKLRPAFSPCHCQAVCLSARPFLTVGRSRRSPSRSAGRRSRRRSSGGAVERSRGPVVTP